MNRRPSSTAIMHAMAFEGNCLIGEVRNRLYRWDYNRLASDRLSPSIVHVPLPLRNKCVSFAALEVREYEGFHYSSDKECSFLTEHDYVECYGMKNSLPFVIHHRVGECPR